MSSLTATSNPGGFSPAGEGPGAARPWRTANRPDRVELWAEAAGGSLWRLLLLARQTVGEPVRVQRRGDGAAHDTKASALVPAERHRAGMAWLGCPPDGPCSPGPMVPPQEPLSIALGVASGACNARQAADAVPRC